MKDLDCTYWDSNETTRSVCFPITLTVYGMRRMQMSKKINDTKKTNDKTHSVSPNSSTAWRTDGRSTKHSKTDSTP